MVGKHSSILVLPDAHAYYGVSNERFSMLGRYIAHKRPDKLVCLGDLCDATALSFYDKGRKKAEGRRVIDDIKVTIDAQERLFKEINRLNIQLKKQGKPSYNPQTFICIGNHEARFSRAAEKDPEYYGMISIDQLRYNEFWDVVVPFLEPLTIEGISFCHYWPNAMGRPINSVNSIMNLPGGSKVSGHTHVWDQRRDGRISPKVALIAGCFLDPKKQIKGDAMDYASVFQRQAWFNGVFLLNEVHNGSCLPVPVTYEYLKANFGTSEKD